MDTENTNHAAGPAAHATQNTAAQPRSWKSWIAALLLTAAVCALALSVWKPEMFKAAAPAPKTQAQKEEYYCPMHPQQRSDKPGNCPICSMNLVQIHKTPQANATPAATPGEAAGPSTIFISPQRQQLIGVRSVPAAFRPLVKEIRTLGKVAFDETKITHIHTKVAGFIEDVFADFLGKPVKRGDPLFTIYSPDLVATQQEYLLALRSANILKDSSFPWISAGSKNLLEAARRRLRLWDVSEEEIQQLEREGQPKRALTICSPVSGVVTERAAYHHGKYVTPEIDLYTIVDLSTVWVLGEVYESDLPYINLGQTVQVEFPYTGGMTDRSGKIVFIQPTLDAATRTAKVRLEFSNPNLLLRPGMFVHFRVRVPLGVRLAVPDDAVLDTGTEQYVFLDRGHGYFEPRPITLGPAAGGYYAVERGLKPGERVVTSANFILDSESRLKSASANMGPTPAERSAPRTPTPGSTLKSGSESRWP